MIAIIITLCIASLVFLVLMVITMRLIRKAEAQNKECWIAIAYRMREKVIAKQILADIRKEKEVEIL